MAARPLSPPPADAAEAPSLEDLSEREFRALMQAATWYASYHAHMMSESADDPSAAAVAKRERYVDLHHALWKLGIRRALPDALRR